MIAAVLFDFGGTLDGDGLHWLDRFYEIYASQPGFALPQARIKDAFYHADRALEADPAVATYGFREMMRRHAALQLERLGIADGALREALAEGFRGPAVDALARNRAMLASLHAAGLRLGVVSNFYGNVATLCEEAGLAPYLQVVLDSAVVGLSKPDPRLFQMALDRIGVPASEAAFVGDSFDRDIRPARSLGMRTFWLAPGRETCCPDPSLVDGILTRLADLPSLVLAGRVLA